MMAEKHTPEISKQGLFFLIFGSEYPFLWTTKERIGRAGQNWSNLHTAVPSQDTEAWREQRANKWKRSFSYQNHCESLLQFTWFWHGQFQRHVVSSEISVLIHAPCVPHVSSLTKKLSPPHPSSSNWENLTHDYQGEISAQPFGLFRRPHKAPYPYRLILALVTSSK